MNRLATILPASNVLLDVDATSKKRAFEHAGVLFENLHAIGSVRRANLHGLALHFALHQRVDDVAADFLAYRARRPEPLRGRGGRARPAGRSRASATTLARPNP